MLDEALHIQCGRAGKNVFGLREDVFEKGGRDYAQGYFAVNAAEGEIVDFVAERWNVCALAGVNLHRKYILAIQVHMLCELEGERREAALIFSQAHPIEPY